MFRKFILVSGLAAILSCPLRAQEESYSYGLDAARDSAAFAAIRSRMDSIRAHRPTVALVLSGGGAKAAAQVGPLAKIEELGIPVDLLVGASMGGYVGGMYCAGRTPEELRDLIVSRDWNALVLETPSRRTFSVPDKIERDTYMLTWCFGHDGKRSRGIIPNGAFQAQGLWNLISSQTVGYHDSMDFMTLPVPFVSVSTDVVTSEPKIWHSGSLTTAMMTTFSVPGLFPAVHDHGMVLTDGAMYNNNPTNVAYSLGADIVIGLDVSAPVVPEEDVNDVADVLGQVFDLPGMKNQNASRDRMDLKIRPNLEGYNLLMFSKESIDSLMARGYAAAKIAEPDLRAIRELTGPAAPKRKASIDFMSRPVHISGVRLEGVPESEKTAVLRVLGVSEDEDRMLSYEEAEEMAWRLRGTRCYERVIYEFDGESEPLRLVLRCRQQAADRLALSLRFDTETFASVQFDVDRGGFRKGGSLGLSGRVGFHSFLEGGYTYRTWSGWDFSAKVSVHGVFHNYMSGFNGDLGFHRQDARIAAGVNLGTFARVEAGVKAEHLWIPFPDRHRVIASAQARVMGDSFDNGYFPSRGIRFSAGGGYHFLSYDPSGVSLKPFLDADLSFKAVIPIGGHFALLPAVSARYVSKDGASNVVYCNALAPSAGGLVFDGQIPFVGLNHPLLLDDEGIAVAGLDARFHFGRPHYLTLKGNAAYVVPEVADFGSGRVLWGAALEYGFAFLTGPVIRGDIHWSGTDGLGAMLALGLDF